MMGLFEMDNIVARVSDASEHIPPRSVAAH
jgi:hypothetical protein